MSTTRCWINGISGRMGQEILHALVDDGKKNFEWIGGSCAEKNELADHLDRVDLIYDFSTPAGNQILREALQHLSKAPAVVVGTTGLTEEEKSSWGQVKGPILMAPNTSVGVSLALKAALAVISPAIEKNFDVEIVETHHRAKLDAPSGTALYLGHSLAACSPELSLVIDRKGARKPGEIGMHAVRGGGVFGEHEVRLIGDHEEIKISHRAFSRALFGAGALHLGKWLVEQPAKLYGLRDVDYS